jgi:para-aminobenzoate synthetase / 4-amino-4-deoxychorismate lyase
MRPPHAVIDFPCSGGGLPALQLAFAQPLSELFAWTTEEVVGVLMEVDALARSGYWCAGYLRYEAAAAFEHSAALHTADGPLAYFSVHKRPMAFPDLSHEPAAPLDWQLEASRDRFEEDVALVQAAIARGEAYQVNYTSALNARYAGEPFALFCSMLRAQRGAYAAWFSNTEESVLSTSPELFFDWDGEILTCRPMKGTAARGPTPDIDRGNAAGLRASEKERAENVMIVDLIRNDLSRIAETGSVRVTSLFDCEPWPTVWQMTSTVLGRTRGGVGLTDVFRTLFPCGSVTGAPKLRAMHWIKELEPAARGVYCGAAGVVLPGGAARFNVPIRTVVVRAGRARYGVGSGITTDSTPSGEWAEWHCKTESLRQASSPFCLLQTMRIELGQLPHLELHLDRLQAAASHFGFTFDREAAREQLRKAAAASPDSRGRMRVTVNVRGILGIDITSLPPSVDKPQPVVLAERAVAAPTAFLRHKTTRRDQFEPFAAGTPEAFDTLLWNELGEVTEFTRGNVIVELADGRRVTPSLRCGLLDGVGRAIELATGRVEEAVVRAHHIDCARRIWFVNALRGLIEVEMRSSTSAPSTSRELQAVQ